ncbi:MAG: FKBP-type peptidylprolyl cis-trans isomerase [Parcubacteria group bacterium GW2011_GWA2_40_8]|nr:MAG: FKBP-type peptidylprolyl cis-trans isomerase [Parcubacteria group bacterium GW2011_GWA2_40_8]
MTQIQKINTLNFIIGLVVIGIIMSLGLYFVNSFLKDKNTNMEQQQSGEQPEDMNMEHVSPAANEEFKTEDLVVGTGAEAKAGDTVSVNYVGTLTDGTKFDSSYDRTQPFSFTIGTGSVIQGWEQGIPGMKEGGKRKLTIPAELGYGDRVAGGGAIPANSTLIFEVELLNVE